MLIGSETVLGCGLAATAGFVLNGLVAGWMRARGGLAQMRHRRASLLALRLNTVASPLWTWFLSIFMQALVYPTCAALSVLRVLQASSSTSSSGYHSGSYSDSSSAGRSSGSWSSAIEARGSANTTSVGTWIRGVDPRPLHHPDNLGLRLFLYCFFGYLVRDMPSNTDSPMFLVHHAVCMFGIVCTLETTSPGALAAALGMLAMEEGSLFYNLWAVDAALFKWPDFLPCWPRCGSSALENPLLTQIYMVMMTLSNMVAMRYAWVAAQLSFRADVLGFAWAGLVCGLPLAAKRQLDVITSEKPKLLQ